MPKNLYKFTHCISYLSTIPYKKIYFNSQGGYKCKLQLSKSTRIVSFQVRISRISNRRLLL